MDGDKFDLTKICSSPESDRLNKRSYSDKDFQRKFCLIGYAFISSDTTKLFITEIKKFMVLISRTSEKILPSCGTTLEIASRSTVQSSHFTQTLDIRGKCTIGKKKYPILQTKIIFFFLTFRRKIVHDPRNL